MQEQTKTVFENLCREIHSSFTGVLTWKWDSRFESLLIEFKHDQTKAIRDVLDKHLSYIWERSSLKQAPEVVQNIGEELGGLMTDQLLLTSDPDQGVRVFCAWWPWGDQSTISIRLVPDYKIFDDSAKAELISRTKNLFGI